MVDKAGAFDDGIEEERMFATIDVYTLIKLG